MKRFIVIANIAITLEQRSCTQDRHPLPGELERRLTALLPSTWRFCQVALKTSLVAPFCPLAGRFAAI